GGGGVEGPDGRDRARGGRGRRRGGQCRDGERAVHEGDAVVCVRRPGGVDRVAARAAGRDCVRCQGHGRGQAGRGIAVDEPPVAGRQGRQRRPVGLALVVRGQRQGGRADRQGAAGEADVVVGRRGGSRGDVVAADGAGGRGRGAHRRLGRQAGGGVAVDEPAV